ncbi:uncharacterized protein LOC143283696 [Babylonia areolata]|uniref:uncharacterized protein LOC143283696 n=1 Tax=Babylonia areolata TaxID=304850 RepID=UPI003FD2A50F
MKIPRRLMFWRRGNGGMSLVQGWMLLVVVATLLVLIDLRVLWRQVDSPTGQEAVTLQERLRDGYSHPAVPSRLSKGGRRISGRSASSQETVSAHGWAPARGQEDQQKLNLHDLLLGDGGGGVGGEEERGARGGGTKEGGGGRGVKRTFQGEGKGKEKKEGGGGGVRVGVKSSSLGASEMSRDAANKAGDLLLYSQSLKLKPHSRWIVLDVTSGKCQDPLAVPSGWRILAVGEVASLKGCSPPACTYLPPVMNVKGKKTATPEKPLTVVFRKNLAYLAAISSGAEYLLDVDCTMTLKNAIGKLRFPPHMDHGPMYNESLWFNAYAHFGAWAVVPRVLSGGEKRPSPNSRMYFVRDFDGNVLVKHGVSDTSPDAAPLDGGTSGTKFDPSIPPVFLGQRSFSAAVPTCSLYRKAGFWSLLLPCQVPTLRCHVLRQLIQQRLFRDLDAFSGFYQLKTTTTPLQGNTPPLNGVELIKSQADVEKLVSLLDAWMCKPASKFLQCLDVLSDDLHQARALSEEEYSLLKAWVSVLGKAGGPAAAVQPASRVRTPWRGVRKTSEVRVTLGSMQLRLASGGRREERMLKARLVDKLAERCDIPANSNGHWFPVAQWRRPVIEDIVLIIVFNWNIFFWNNLPFTETMHRPFFKHIFYCVPNVDELLVDNKDDILRHISFVEGLSDTWYFMYECVTIVARMNIQGVRGYLQIGDDTLTNSWKYLKAPRDNMWIPHGFSTMRADQPTHDWRWYWWPKSRGRPAVLQAMADLEQISGLSSDQLLKLDPNYGRLKKPVNSFSDMYQEAKASFPPMQPMLPGSERWEPPTQEEAVNFMKNYYKANRLSGRVKHRALDFFYIPQTLIDGWVKFTRHFLRRNVLIELAVPAIHYGLVPKSEVKYVSASSLWKGDRNASYSFYDEVIFFLHPFKMKAHMDKKDSRDFFCNDYMKTLFYELARLVKVKA